jgi:hypothetical protein
MHGSDKLNLEDEKQFMETISKVSPAIADIIARKDSGEITIFFHEGKFKKAKKNVTV